MKKIGVNLDGHILTYKFLLKFIECQSEPHIEKAGFMVCGDTCF